jgi:hypothetical protein
MCSRDNSIYADAYYSSYYTPSAQKRGGGRDQKTAAFSNTRTSVARERDFGLVREQEQATDLTVALLFWVSRKGTRIFKIIEETRCSMMSLRDVETNGVRGRT